MKINWSRRSDNPKDMLCVKERLGYSFANTGIAFSYTIILCFLSFYYTDVVGIAPGIVGTILLLSRVFDGISDMLMGWVLTEDTEVPPSSFGIPEEDTDSPAADNTKCFFP